MRLIIHFGDGNEIRKVNLREKIVLVVKKRIINHYKNLSPAWILINLSRIILIHVVFLARLFLFSKI